MRGVQSITCKAMLSAARLPTVSQPCGASSSADDAFVVAAGRLSLHSVLCLPKTTASLPVAGRGLVASMLSSWMHQETTMSIPRWQTLTLGSITNGGTGDLRYL